MYRNDVRTIQQGSRLFPYDVPAIVHATTYWYDLFTAIGNEAYFWDYMDSLIVTNNSALPIHFYLDSKSDDYLILPYSMQPITGRAFRRFGFYNPDAALDVTAADVTMKMRRLPPDVLSTIGVS